MGQVHSFYEVNQDRKPSETDTVADGENPAGTRLPRARPHPRKGQEAGPSRPSRNGRRGSGDKAGARRSPRRLCAFPWHRFPCQMPGAGLPVQGRQAVTHRDSVLRSRTVRLSPRPRASQTTRRLTRPHTVSGEVACYSSMLHFYFNFLAPPPGREHSRRARGSRGGASREGRRPCAPSLPPRQRAVQTLCL